MRIPISIILLYAATALLSATYAPRASAVPEAIDYQAYLTAADGSAFDGSVPITFAAYNVPTGGVPLWSESQTVIVEQGLLTVTLGSAVNPFPAGLFDGPVFIGLFVAGETMSPRRALTSAPFAFTAADAQTLGGMVASDLDQSADVAALQSDVGSLDTRVTTLEANPGDITGVVAGTGLAGGGVTGTVSINVANGGIGAAQLAANAVSGVNIVNGSVGSADIGNGAVATPNYAAESIFGSHIASGAVGNSELANGAVSASKLNSSGTYTFGRVGVSNSAPDEELVIGTNLGSGWALPALTVGGASGGAVEVGTSTISLSTDSSSTFGRSRMIANDGNGFGQGLIEMRTRQLNIGRSPGVNTTRTYPLRVVQNISGQGGNYGINLINGVNSVENWELYVGTTSANNGNLVLYHNNALRGQFNASSGAYSATSDARLKTNVSRLEDVLPRLLQLSPKVYSYKADLTRTFNGFLAQDVRRVFPELVSEVPARAGQNEDSTLLVDYSQLAALAIGGIQEQQALLASQQLDIERQGEQLEAQARLLQTLSERLSRLER